ncbi:YraN family protein [Candidatus Uhrbacteria bacterium]|nr:YraN family protein [Candidatus Uhrbacteria bacterium]
MFFRRRIKEPNWSKRAEVGKWGEEKAAEYLNRKGYKIVARHWTHRIGELDIVAARDGRIIFVEVRTKTSLRYGRPEESVGWHKQERLRRAANVYMLKHKLGDVPYQIDFLAVIYDSLLKETKIQHMENVISGR